MGPTDSKKEEKKHTYQITYGVAIIVLTLVLNDMALYIITGHSLVPITTYNQETPMEIPGVPAMTGNSTTIPVPGKTGTSTSSTSPTKQTLPR